MSHIVHEHWGPMPMAVPGGLKIEIFVVEFEEVAPDTIECLMATPLYVAGRGDGQTFNVNSTISGKTITIDPAFTGRSIVWVFGT